MGNRALDQARLEWVSQHRELAHEIYTLAAQGDKTALGLRKHIWDKAHLTERQVSFAKAHLASLKKEETR